MTEYLICNAVPNYKEAPVAIDLLKNKTTQILDAMNAKKAERNYLILGTEEKEVRDKIETEQKNFPDLNLEIIAVDSSFGFVYTNASAIKKLIKGEKTIPSNQNQDTNIYSVEGLLNETNKSVYLDGSVNKKGFFSFPNSVTPSTILDTCGLNGTYKGIYFGFPMATFLGENDLNQEVTLTTDRIIVFNEADCILYQLKKIAEGYLTESCGRCVFGYEGITQINMFLSEIQLKKGKPDDIALLRNLCNEMKGQALCGIDATLASAVISAFDCFKDEIEEHITKKSCKAMYCNKFITYHILTDRCTGCTDCMDVCEDDAILGKKKFIHVIDQDECTQCGACVTACEEEAIVKAGAIKPRCPQKPIPCKR